MRLQGKIALVTGSSSGIGRGIALRFAQEGADVVVHYNRSEEKAYQVVDNVKKLGRKAVALQADVAEVKQVQELVNQAWKAFGRLDILVNNAGVLLSDPFLKVTERDWDKVLDINLKGVFFCTQAVVKRMVENKIRGKIINISSSSGMQGEPYLSLYCASKAGVNLLTQSLAIELGPHGININGIVPGFIEGTDINPPRPATSPVYLKHCLLTIPCKRFGKVEDILGAAVLLASNESDYIQGESIVIDGGLTIQTEDDLGESGEDTSYGLTMEGAKTSYGQVETSD